MGRERIFLGGIGIGTYRSFGEEVQRIGPFRKLNVFIGQNNSGKSNILRFLSEQYEALVKTIRGEYQAAPKLTEVDRHLSATNNRFIVELSAYIDSTTLPQVLGENSGRVNPNHYSLIKKLTLIDAIAHNTDMLWFPFTGRWGEKPTIATNELCDSLIKRGILQNREWEVLWSVLTNKSGGNLREAWVPQTLAKLALVATHILPPISIIPAIRQVSASVNAEDDFSGVGLVDRLARLRDPAYDKQHLKRHFGDITEFVRSVVGNSTATIEIPYERDMLVVHMDGKTLPLASLGTGIHEVTILAAAATVLRNQIVCIEEPEIHLHPALQRKLLQYLADKTDNQYFITTHSAHVLETNDIGVFHVTLEKGASVVKRAITPSDKAEICADLGYRASDLLQTNCIIWVEGPSDRIYLNHWIRAVAPELVEGLHYSIMFYGGRLLSHLTANDPEVDDFISLRRLNRRIAIVIDSDKRSAQTPINATKKRVAEEFNRGPGFAWITKGREIENYVPRQMLETAVRSCYPDMQQLSGTQQYDDCLSYISSNRKNPKCQADKLKTVHQVTKQAADLSVLDLRRHIDELVAFIRTCSD